jgi:hypothetical protein
MPVAAAVSVLAAAFLAACSSASSSTPAPVTAATAAAAQAATVATCEGAFTADIGGGPAKLAADAVSAMDGQVPACKGLTNAQIEGAYGNAEVSLPVATTPAAVPSSAPAPPSSSPPSLAGKTVATFSGSGIENTPKFTVTDTWKLSYSFDCSTFGYKGNFQVYEDGGFSGVTVNDLATSKSGSTYAYGDAGTHYLEVNSECSWSVKVIDESSS